MYRENRKSVIMTLFGSSPQTRILDLFMDNPLFEFTRNEIIEALGMAKSTLYSTLPGLEEAGVIVETRQIGKASLYRLNGESLVVQDLRGMIRRYAKTIAQNETATDSTVIEEEKHRAPLA
jgi:DNA-binding transcriptional ArsR family regulator